MVEAPASLLVVRDYLPSDFEAIRWIHENTQIDYQFPNLNSPLFLVTKVVEQDGVIRAAGGLYLQLETYLWMDPTNWGTLQEKSDAIQALAEAGFKEAWLQGLECAVLYLPPGMEEFGNYLVNKLGFAADRDGWVSYSKRLGDE